MKIILGLGNPGTQYEHTRHNTGFFSLQSIAKQWGGVFAEKPRLKASIAETHLDGEKLLLVQPTTFYNLAGESARSIIDFYKLEPADVLVIHDDIDLPFGTIRTRLGGSGGGSNGIKSINQHIGNDYYRMRIGIANELRGRVDAANFVLSKFSKSELEILDSKMLPHVERYAHEFAITGKLVPHTTNELPANSEESL